MKPRRYVITVVAEFSDHNPERMGLTKKWVESYAYTAITYWAGG